MRRKSNIKRNAVKPVQRYREAWDYTVARLMELDAIEQIVDIKVKERLSQMFDKDKVQDVTRN